MVEVEPRGRRRWELTVESTWLEVWGMSVRAPVTAGTNVVLAVQCALYVRGLHGADSERSVWWRRFFAGMAVATGAGVLKHGFPHVLSSGWYEAMLWVLTVAGGAAVYCAQRATIATRASVGALPWLERAARAGAALFLLACIALGPRISVLIAYNAIGLLPVLAVEVWAACTKRPGGAGVASGLLVSVLAGLVNGFRLSPWRWLTHVDIAHALMAVSFLSIYAGVSVARRGALEEDVTPSGSLRVEVPA